LARSGFGDLALPSGTLYVLILYMNLKLTTAILLTAGLTLSASMIAQQTPAAKSSTASTTTTNKTAAQKSAPVELKTEKEKASYSIGASIGRNLHNDGIDIDTAILLRGLKDGLSGGTLKLTDDEIRTTIITLQKDAREKQNAKMKVLGEENQKQGDAFLAANKSREGVVTLPSGVQYKVIKQGDGPKPAASDTVVCNYRGTLVDGKEFDSSAKHGGPATFPVSGVIKGWTEVLQLMPVGSNYQVVIPAALAYGPRGPADIGPNATLVFDIELVSVKEKPAAAATPAAPGTTEPSTDKPAEPTK
jgi:FKBP-type peptidyl-prolyl cis-trans isomerase FklB